MRMARSMLASGKGKGSLEEASHWKAWQRAGSYRGWSWKREVGVISEAMVDCVYQGTFTICTAEAAKSQQ